jgi:ABC-type dipeptide/oligopeptide/nickel transport system permease subunit
VFFVESGFLLILAILYGFVNYSNEPRIKTSLFTVLVVLGFIGWETYAYINGVKNLPMIVTLGLSLLSLFYIMVAGLRKGSIINYFKTIKDNIFYEYTYQKLFARPSISWAAKFKISPEKRRRIWFKDFAKLSSKEKVLTKYF